MFCVFDGYFYIFSCVTETKTLCCSGWTEAIQFCRSLLVRRVYKSHRYSAHNYCHYSTLQAYPLTKRATAQLPLIRKWVWITQKLCTPYETCKILSILSNFSYQLLYVKLSSSVCHRSFQVPKWTPSRNLLLWKLQDTQGSNWQVHLSPTCAEAVDSLVPVLQHI